MTFDELERYLQSIPEKIADDVPDIIAETAVEYYKESFQKKAFDGKPWVEAKTKKKRGSLLVDSGNMINSITVKESTPERVTISAGNDKVPYARAHNEGSHDVQYVKPYHRQRLDASDLKSRKRVKVGGKQVKGFSRKANIPKRQFIGKSNELAAIIKDRIDGYLSTIL